MGGRVGFYVVVLAVGLLAATGLGILEPRAERPASARRVSAAAATAVPDNGDNGALDNAPADNSPNGADNKGSADNSSNNDNANSDNFGFTETVPIAVSVPTPTVLPEETSICAPAGQESVLLSPDGRVTVRTSPALASDVRLTVRPRDVLASVPPTTGLRVGGFLFDLSAASCAGEAIEGLPTEVRLAVRYDDLDVSALDEQRLLIARLDPLTSTWQPAPAQTVDPLANSISATVAELGLYTVYATLP